MREQRSGARAAVIGCAWAAALAAPVQAWAQDEIIINDSFREEQQARIQSIELIDGEAYGVDFDIPQSLLPIEMLGVRVVMVSDPNSGIAQSDYCGRFAIEVYEEGVAGGGSCTDALTGFFTFNYLPPGQEIYNMTAQFANNPIGFLVNADSRNFQDLRFSTINNDPNLMVTIPPVILTQPRVRVALRALDLACGARQGQKYPIVLTDADGIQADNWVDGYFAGGTTANCPDRMNAPQTGLGWNWYDWASFEPLASPLTSSGDYVIRLILRGNGVNPMPDAGMDMGTDMGSDSGIIVVDMGPDGSVLDVRPGTDADLEEDTGGGGGQDTGGGGDQDTGGAADTGNGGGDDEDTGGNTGGGDELLLEAISPSSAPADASTDVLILGEGFELGLEVSLNARKIGVIEVERERITANVPSGLEEGSYDVIVTNPDGESAILVGAFTVGDGLGGGDGDGGEGGANGGGNGNGVDAGCGCRSVGASGHGMPGSLWGFALMGLVALRRRRARA